jgi:23S rRNA pseudouridine2605 synthase
MRENSNRGGGKRNEKGKFDSKKGSGKPARTSSSDFSKTSSSSKPEDSKKTGKKPFSKGKFNPGGGFKKSAQNRPRTEAEGIRINRYLSNAGVATRRQADDLILAGTVTINGKVVTELGVKVMPGDEVVFEGTRLKKDTKRYILLNKPKDFVAATFDPKGRKTVMNLIAKACKEPVAPVGKMERMTTGVLLLTNDEDLTRKLANPTHSVKRIFHVGLDKKVTGEHMKQLESGVQLEEGIVKFQEVSLVGIDKKEVGLEIHLGKNSAVKRAFESLGYTVSKIDCVYFAGLTKKDLPRGNWKHLDQEELSILMRLPSGKKKTTTK